MKAAISVNNSNTLYIVVLVSYAMFFKDMIIISIETEPYDMDRNRLVCCFGRWCMRLYNWSRYEGNRSRVKMV